MPPHLPKYICFSANKGRGAGVAIYIREKFKLLSGAHIWAEEAYQAVKLQLDKFDVIAIYRSPNIKGLESFIDFVKNIIDDSRPTIICGDMNINLIENRNSKFTKTMSSLGFI